jgi:heme-degrading monooxygenase HmoA
MKNVFVYIWEYLVKEEKKSEFEKIYGPEGQWVQLFKKGIGYLGTELHQDTLNPLRYVTIDYWISQKARNNFREQFAEQIEKLDKQCESMTEKEIFLGDFEGYTNKFSQSQKQE